MTEYISLKAAIDVIMSEPTDAHYPSWYADKIKSIPTADVAPVMAEWKVYEYDTPQCTSCGMWMPFARYRRGQGTNARRITDFCPSCGKKMTSMPMCESCVYGNGKWKDDGICFACREQVWIPGKPHIQAGNEKQNKNCCVKMDGDNNEE